MSYVLPILILFFIANLSIFINGIDVWFGWNFTGIGVFFVILAKFVFIVAITVGLLAITHLEEHPLVLAGLVFSIFAIANSSYQNYLFAWNQNSKHGEAVKIKASELHLHPNLYETPYVKIVNSGLGKIKTFKKKLKPDYINYVEYDYAELLNTEKPAIIINRSYKDDYPDVISMIDQKEKNEIVAIALPKRYDNLRFLNTMQFSLAPKTFEAFYLEQKKAFFRFVRIVNSIGVAFSMFFIIFKKYI